MALLRSNHNQNEEPLSRERGLFVFSRATYKMKDQSITNVKTVQITLEMAIHGNPKEDGRVDVKTTCMTHETVNDKNTQHAMNCFIDKESIKSGSTTFLGIENRINMYELALHTLLNRVALENLDEPAEYILTEIGTQIESVSKPDKEDDIGFTTLGVPRQEYI